LPNPNMPTGIVRAEEYGVKNIVLEVTLACLKLNWAETGMDNYCKLISSRIEYIRNKISPNGFVFLNIRDLCKYSFFLVVVGIVESLIE
jgi:hypothetical protein